MYDNQNSTTTRANLGSASRNPTLTRYGIRQNCTPFDHYTLNKALLSCDAIAAMIEGAIRYPLSITPERLITLAESLRQAADTLDPRVVRQMGGCRHDR